MSRPAQTCVLPPRCSTSSPRFLKLLCLHSFLLLLFLHCFHLLLHSIFSSISTTSTTSSHLPPLNTDLHWLRRRDLSRTVGVCRRLPLDSFGRQCGGVERVLRCSDGRLALSFLHFTPPLDSTTSLNHSSSAQSCLPPTHPTLPPTAPPRFRSRTDRSNSSTSLGKILRQDKSLSRLSLVESAMGEPRSLLPHSFCLSDALLFRLPETPA